MTSCTDRELAKYLQFVKEKNKIFRALIQGEIHARPEERQWLIKFGREQGKAVEELIKIVSPDTFYH